MLSKLFYIFGINFITFGGGGVFIPLYETYYVDKFHLMSQSDYYGVVSIVNALPGVTGGKLAAYGMFFDYGIFGMILGILAFILPGILMIFAVIKIIDKMKDNRIFIRVNALMKPVVAGILLSITFDFWQVALSQYSIITFLGILLISTLCIKQFKISMFNTVILFLVISITIVQFTTL